MGNPIKKLAGQTMIYGMSSILARVLNFFLTPLYVREFAPDEYGVYTDIYSVVGFLLVVFTFGMETSFFRFANKTEDKKHLYKTALSFLTILNVVFLLAGLLFSQQIANLTGYSNHLLYIICFQFILFFDVLSSLPMAKLRLDDKPKKFAVINTTNIAINIVLNLVFILVLRKHYPQFGIELIFFANLIASFVKLLLLVKDFKVLSFKLDLTLLKPMLKYAYPMVFIGLAGIVNEMLDRQMLKYILIPIKGEDYALTQLGIYGANYKFAALITMFIQAFRYAAEPFFFKSANDKKNVYGPILKYFTIVTCLFFLFVTLYLDVLKDIILGNQSKGYWEGVKIVWILLLANIFSGIYTNISIWYKLSDKTNIGAYISFYGALVTIVLNYIYIPTYGYMASAFATLIVYSTMVVISYFLGQKYYPINYPVGKVIFYITLALGLYYISIQLSFSGIIKYAINTLLLLAYSGFAFVLERKSFLNKL